MTFSVNTTWDSFKSYGTGATVSVANGVLRIADLGLSSAGSKYINFKCRGGDKITVKAAVRAEQGNGALWVRVGSITSNVGDESRFYNEDFQYVSVEYVVPHTYELTEVYAGIGVFESEIGTIESFSPIVTLNGKQLNITPETIEAEFNVNSSNAAVTITQNGSGDLIRAEVPSGSVANFSAYSGSDYARFYYSDTNNTFGIQLRDNGIADTKLAIKGASGDVVMADGVSTGKVIFGANVDNFGNTSTGRTPRYQFSGRNINDATIGYYTFSDDQNGNSAVFFKSRGNGNALHSPVQNNDDIGSIFFEASDGAKFVRSASIKVESSANATTDSAPGKITFAVTPIGGVLPTKRLAIDGDSADFTGNVTIDGNDVYHSGNTGTAVTYDVTTSATDTTANRLLETGDGGLLRVANGIDYPKSSFNDATCPSGLYRYINTTTDRPSELAAYGYVFIERYDTNDIKQTFCDVNGERGVRLIREGVQQDFNLDYHSGNTNFNEFGGNASNDTIAFGYATSASEASFLLPISSLSAPVSITVSGTVTIVNPNGVVVAGGSGVTPTLQGSSGIKIASLQVTGLSGMTVGDFLLMRIDSAIDSITVNF